MKSILLLLALCALALASSPDFIDATTVYIQASDASPVPLAEIEYNPSTLSASLLSYDAPFLPPTSKTVRIGLYDPSSSSWKSSTSVTSAESFAKGFRPTIVLSLDAQGGVLGVSCKSGLIDAGQTRDFGPRVRVVRMEKVKAPSLNRPVVLSAEGKVAQPEPEKTMLQKYWWVLLAGVMLLMTTGGGD